MLVPLLLLVVAGLAVVGFFVFTELLDDGRGRGGGGGSAAAEPVEIVSGRDFDPLGGDGEHPEVAADAIDGDPASAWITEGYNSSDMDKEGVGYAFDLGEAVEVAGIRLDTTLPGWTFELYGSEEDFTAPPTDGRLTSTDGEDTFQADRVTEIELDPVMARYVLVWITELPTDGSDYRANIAEAEIQAAGG
jgi:putative peptidoglycan lipid II flippase